MTRTPTLLAAVALAAVLLTAPPAPADPEPIPCAPDACEPAPPCDPQTLVNLGQQVHMWRGRAEVAEAEVVRLEDRLAARRDLVERLRARVARLRGWSGGGE